MNRRQDRLFALLIALVLAATPGVSADGRAADPAADGVFPYAVHDETLDNGLRVVLIPMSSNGLVAYWSIVRTGSRDEYEPGRSGFAHFFEHMMFRGTERYSSDEYNDLMTRMGADANAYTTDDLTAYHIGVAAEDLERVIELESDRFRNLQYDKAGFETEAGAVYGEYRKNRTNPFFAIYEKMRETAFTTHTYGHTTMGYERDIKRMPSMFDYSRRFFGRYYRPDNIVLLIAGEVDVEPTMTMVRAAYGDWEPGYVAPKVAAEPAQRGERRVEVDYDGRSLPIVWVAYKASAFDPDDTQYAAASLLAELAFGETSEIHKRLVLDEQLVEFIAADQEMNRDPGVWEVYTRVKDPDRVDDVQAAIDATIERYRTELPDAARLADLKSRLRYGFLMRLDTPDRVASSLARLVAVTGGVDAVDALYRSYERVTAEDVRDAARALLVPDRRTVGVLRGSK